MGQNIRGQNVSWVKLSFKGLGSKCLGSKCLGVKVSLGSKCLFLARGQSVSGVKMSSGSKFLGVKVSLGSKCRWGQSVFGVKMGVSPPGGLEDQDPRGEWLSRIIIEGT